MTLLQKKINELVKKANFKIYYDTLKFIQIKVAEVQDDLDPHRTLMIEDFRAFCLSIHLQELIDPDVNRETFALEQFKEYIDTQFHYIEYYEGLKFIQNMLAITNEHEPFKTTVLEDFRDICLSMHQTAKKTQ
mgnify:CR=1 FL=1